RRDAAELRKLVSAERTRLADILIADRSWPVDEWRQVYLDHPVTGRLAARLLWLLEDGADARPRTGLPLDRERFVSADGTVVIPGAGARIRPWHPVRADPDEARSWRRYLADQEILQPLRQVFREVYLLTEAEQSTRVYSNRFAAHVLRYRQAYALMRSRNWRTAFSHDNEATRDFDGYGLRAVLSYSMAAVDPGSYEAGYCTTGQVRFVRVTGRAGDPVPLADVPPAVFSEAMRDVDLFVGVASIATDPT